MRGLRTTLGDDLVRDVEDSVALIDRQRNTSPTIDVTAVTER